MFDPTSAAPGLPAPGGLPATPAPMGPAPAIDAETAQSLLALILSGYQDEQAVPLGPSSPLTAALIPPLPGSGDPGGPAPAGMPQMGMPGLGAPPTGMPGMPPAPGLPVLPPMGQRPTAPKF
jgi:hypothetical protein